MHIPTITGPGNPFEYSEPKPCPTCGRCPTCGHQPAHVNLYPPTTRTTTTPPYTTFTSNQGATQ